MAMTKEERKEKMQAIYNQIDAGIDAVLSSDKWQDFLKLQARFYKYSFHNTMLIHWQMPTASYVAGFNKWNNEFKRRVKKGAKAIKILAPRIVKEVDEESGEEKETLAGFKVVNVFDVSQTEGEALPTICNELQGNDSAAVFIIDRLMKVIKIPVKFGDTGNAKGCYHPVENWIMIKPGMSDNQTAKTLAHEYTHSILHAGKCDKPTDLKEIEAESVAFIVCNYFGLETNDYSFEYLASWSRGREKKEIRELGELIQKTAAVIIDEISAVTGGIDYKPVDTIPATPPASMQIPADKPPVHKAGKKIEISVKKRQAGELVDVMVTAYTTATPGLVVHKAVTGRGYILAHQQSGLMVADFSTKKEAMEKAALAPKTVDWTASPEEIKNNPDAAEFARYTVRGLKPVHKKAS
jgi:hypothetical protein